MKCRQCGKELEKKNKTCPHCGHVHEVWIPKELDHLSKGQLNQHVQRIRAIYKYRYIFLGIIFIVFGVSISKGYFDSNKRVTPVLNFHDDLIENTSSNALGNSIPNLLNGGRLLQSGNQIYASDQQGVYKISLALDKKELLLETKATYLNACENGFYYIDANDKNTICFYDGSVTKLNIQATQLTLVGDYLYYLEDNSNRAIYRMHRETKDTKKMTQSQCVQFKISGDWLYFATDDALYQMPVLGGEIMKISDVPYHHFVVDDQVIYYIDKVTGYIHRVKKDGSENKVVVDDPCDCFLLSDRNFFYSKIDGGIYKQNRENGEISTLSNDKGDSLHIAGTWIYYLTTNEEGRFVSVDENSEMITPVQVIGTTNE